MIAIPIETKFNKRQIFITPHIFPNIYSTFVSERLKKVSFVPNRRSRQTNSTPTKITNKDCNKLNNHAFM